MLLSFLVLFFQYECKLSLGTMRNGSSYLDSAWLGLQDTERASRMITNEGKSNV